MPILFAVSPFKSDAVGAHHDRAYFSILHGKWPTMLSVISVSGMPPSAQFPGGEARALQVGPSLGNEDAQFDDPARRPRGSLQEPVPMPAVASASCVALGHDLARWGHEFRAKRPIASSVACLSLWISLRFGNHAGAERGEVPLTSGGESARSGASCVEAPKTGRRWWAGCGARRLADLREFHPLISPMEGALRKQERPAPRPSPAATPIAGAPRMTMSRMAAATSW